MSQKSDPGPPVPAALPHGALLNFFALAATAIMLTSLMFSKFRQRSLELEHIDTGDYTPQEYEGCLIEMQRVNRWLGDTGALKNSLLAEIQKQNLPNFSLLDVGAGSGELLQATADWAKQSGRVARLTGLELNRRSVAAIAERRASSSEITAVRGDALNLPFANNQFDYGLCSLFTHHFGDADVVTILRELARVAARGIFVIDLFRHPVAYFFYTTIGRLFLHNRLIRQDGALSILRSFTPDELKRLGLQAGLQDVVVTRRFPYRLVLSGKKSRAKANVGPAVYEPPQQNAVKRIA